MPHNRRLPKVCEQGLKQPREWLEIEPKVKVVALRFAARARRLTDAGGRPVEITAEDLIQDAWACLAANKPAYDASTSLFKYFYRRIEDRYNKICRDRVENDTSRFQYLPISERMEVSDERKTSVVFLSDPISQEARIEARDELSRLLAWLAHRHPDLYRLARVIFRYGDVDPKDQAFRLCLSLDEIYEMRRRLREVAIRFRNLNNH